MKEEFGKMKICETCRYNEFCPIKETKVQSILTDELGNCQIHKPNLLSPDHEAMLTNNKRFLLGE